ncbi:hypothetical protein FRB95_001517 [Tulasnella sp. JGI-2019a]|nr:hypothetical protein FRB93_002561 [Tulasnella sp. JGI-2019a]KAG9032396.1 hypothetical protein FRB95_001517 [Tulasnella sp. JGI-2019a]
MADPAETARLVLQTLVDVLGVLPIPGLFKDAALAIPVISLKILDMSQGVKRNRKQAMGLALYIANLTDATLRPLKNVDRPFGPAMEPAMRDFHKALQDVEVEMHNLASRNPLKRLVSYNEDVLTMNVFKQRIEDARRIIETEISVATLALVEDINATVTETQRIVGITQDLVEDTVNAAIDTQAVVHDTRVVAINTLAAAEDAAVTARDTLVFVGDTARLASHTRVIVEDTHAAALNAQAMAANTNDVAKDTHHGMGRIGSRLEVKNPNLYLILPF